MRKLLIGLLALLTLSTAYAGTAPFPDTVYVRGGFNDWGLANPMTYDGAAYTATVAIDAGDWEFKIANEGWNNPDWGAVGDPVITLGEATAIGPASFGNLMLSIVNPGNYLFTLSDITFGQEGPGATGGLLTVTQVIPIPAAGLLMLSALGGLGLLRRRR